MIVIIRRMKESILFDIVTLTHTVMLWGAIIARIGLSLCYPVDPLLHDGEICMFRLSAVILLSRVKTDLVSVTITYPLYHSLRKS